MTLKNALKAARSGDEIWVKGYSKADKNSSYVVPSTDGYTLKQGVKLYGGFAGTEASPDQRTVIDKKAYRMTYRTVITGDILRDDAATASDLIFPGNSSRSDNAKHVLTLQAGGTVIDGVTIARGHADGEHGGGILVTGSGSYEIRRCFFIENYAMQGGALYVESSETNGLIDRCGFFNNAAGNRTVAENQGGAVWLAGAGTIVNTAIFNNENGGVMLADGNAQVINSTVVRNTGSGIDCTTDAPVWNTVIWGNSTLSSDNARPDFHHSAYPEANAEGGATNGNVYLAAKNNEDGGPHFSSPSLKTGFDLDYKVLEEMYPLWTWEPMEATPLVDAGDSEAYDENDYGAVDLNGDPRICKGDISKDEAKIDIGAFEFQPVADGRIRYVRQGYTGDGSSWTNASGDVQAMIDYLAESGDGQPGEVWIAAGTYEPQSQLIQGQSYSASFRMRDGISVYGGFAGTEHTKGERDRKKKEDGGMPWEFENETVLMGAHYNNDLAFTSNKWTLTSDSRHVVWFAPMPGENKPGGFTQVTTLDGVTVMGGYAQGDTGLDDFMTDRGAGVYMDGQNSYLTNCIVRENYARGNGGGVYLRDGRVTSSLIFNNNSDQNGGAVYVDNEGLVHRSMLANNSARNGAGVYLDNKAPADGDIDHPEYLILSTCVVSNNTVTGNGAVYCNQGGVLLQNTIVNNQCVTATDLTDPNASQTGGVYINEYALVANSVLWNNRMGADGSSTNIPMYAKNPSTANVRFLYNAISGVNNAVWNNILQEQTLSLVDENAGTEGDGSSIGPRFDEPRISGFDLESSFGVFGTFDKYWQDKTMSYFWQPVSGSNLWARGMALGQLPSEVVLAPEIDIAGDLFAQKPAVGAYMVEKSGIVPALEDNNTLVVYIDADCTEPEHHGSSWATAYRSLNDAIAFFAGLTDQSSITIYNNGSEQENWNDFGNIQKLEIRVLEGDLWPRYAFVNEDPKTATLDILAMQSGRRLKIVGGYYRNNGSNDDVPRDPLNHRSQLNGNPDGDRLEDGLYHVVTVEPGAQVELDGFHVINGYAAGTASLQYGAGMLVRGNAYVTLTNCIFENNKAANGAAIYAADAGHSLTMRNCVVNNNTNTEEASQVIVATNLTLQHVTVVNNVGAAPATMGTTSFSAGNTSGNNLTIATTGEAGGAANFANPTNKQGATLGFDTYLGGYASFRPLTSSEVAGTSIINQAKSDTPADLTTDITTINERNLGGVPDLGAYEAALPKAGTVIYVRDYGEGDLSKENRDGSSWDKAINGRADYGTDDGIENDNISNENVYVNGYNIIGLQYAVNQAYLRMVKRFGNGNIDYQNANVPANKKGGNQSIRYPVLDEKYRNNGAENDKRIQVWVGAGEYTSNAGLFMRDGVDVYGGFPNSGNPGLDDRNPRILENETILKAGAEGPELRGDGDGYSDMPYFDLNEGYDNANTTRRVLTQPLPYYDFGQGGLDVERTNIEVTGFKATTIWNGFTITGGRTHINHQREGGAGVALRQNGVLENCVIKDNVNSVVSSGRGGGIFCNGGTLINCMVESNELKRLNSTRALFGGGIYLRYGTTYNCVYGKNKLTDTDIRNGCELGSAIYIERGNFFNNTVVDNEGCIALGVGKYFQESQLNLINCIVYGNKHPAYNDGVKENSIQIGRLNQSGIAALSITNCCIPSDAIRVVDDSYGGYGTYVELTLENSQSGLTIDGRITSEPQLVGGDNYELSAISPCINAGKSEDLTNEGEPVTLPSSDMNYTNRIKDCTVDIGAYERDNEDTTFPENGVYYVTFTGFGNASANSPENAACADKLQTVLNAAGERAKQGQTVIVKVAGYADDDFVYHANTLADKDNPQSYTFVVPDGVTVMGGYFEGTFSNNGQYQNDGWKENERNAMTYRTVLSAEAVPTQGSTITQNVIGYHAVTFGGGDGTAALTKGAVIDGVWLVDGSATSMAGAGNPATMGGGAIVPGGAHVRNCVVKGNQAVQGGGLYVMPGGTVSGTAILGNTADDGGGVYAANGNTDNGTADSRAHIISATITDNTANSGGGLYLEDGAAMQVNTVIWGNSASTDKNVSGVTSEQYADTKLVSVFNIENKTSFYPFNNCFIETLEPASDYVNTSMQSAASDDGGKDDNIYFADEYRRLKEFSPLIKHGAEDKYFSTGTNSFVEVFGVATTDMRGENRVENTGADRIDAGAFAFPGGILPDELFTRIFVSPGTNVKLSGGDMLDYLGRSFYTSFSTLEDALAYIRKMRDEKTDGASDETHFEILVAGGTYRPTNMRTDAATTVEHDQRLYSFVVPQNVSIYGGFTGEEKYVTPENMQYGDNKFTSIPTDGVTINDVNTTLDQMLSDRKYSDFNGNNIFEPWELASQTILSGAINMSATAKNAYHVLYTRPKSDENVQGGVVLDGLTVMDGETYNVLSENQQRDEAGRGGGLYSNKVGYTISRCRFLNNFGVRGGAVYMRDARLNVVGTIFAGNGTVDEPKQPSTGEPFLQLVRGGAVYLAGMDDSNSAALYAVNSLWVNNGNDQTSYGGAIGTNFADGVETTYDPIVNLMNCTFAKNKAKTNPVIYNHNGKNTITNTLIWGNEGETEKETSVAHDNVANSASDVNYYGLFGNANEEPGSESDSHNILLSATNNGTYGPRFANPATVAGVDGNDATNIWNPAAISIVTDKGDGVNPSDNNNVNDAYSQWFVTDLPDFSEVYMSGGYDRYSGPLNFDEQGTQVVKRPIDIGVYEYQYISNFQTMKAIYVATEESGKGTGGSWADATSDLRGAIVGASNPKDEDGPRTVYVRDGEYSLDRLSAGAAFVLNMVDNVSLENSDLLTIKGSCTGVNDVQDFSSQTVIRNSEVAGTTSQLMSISTNNDKHVVIEGLTFINDGGTGINASTGMGGSLTLKNSALRGNKTSGVNISANSGSVLIYNTLFADNQENDGSGTGLSLGNGVGGENITLVNTTFANNGTDMSTQLDNVYNSVSWNNKTQNMQDADGHSNKVFTNIGNAEDINVDIQRGPNFVDPLNDDVEARDYHIRPSLTLLNKGDNKLYATHVIGSADEALTGERDLGNNARVTDGTIDIGAYEYEAPLQPIVYVRYGLTGDDLDGSSWTKALDDLQGAVDLVGIYADGHPGESGYVFVHNVLPQNTSLRVALPRTKVYGGMLGSENSSTSIYEADGTTISADNVKAVVNDLLDQRKGLIENATRSTLGSLVVGSTAENSVVDGFVVTGNAMVNGGCLSTSVVGNDNAGDNVTGAGSGLLYNSLVYGNVSGVKTVNVTARGTIDNVEGNANNRESVNETNKYVADGEWAYQLNEDDALNLDKGDNQGETKDCIDLVGHDRDIAGNLRIRNTVDNGCFETWNVTTDTDVTDKDYPHGKSVVYVRAGSTENTGSTGIVEGAELVLKKKYDSSTPFNPGVLLLEHRAGLRGNGQNVGLQHVIVERSVPSGGVDMAYAPFSATIENPQNISLKRYDGEARAAYGYAFDSNDGKAWTETATYDGGYGLLLDNTAGTSEARVRFVGKAQTGYAYREGEGMNERKQVQLAQHNNSDTWSGGNTQGSRFTHKENMGWNLFGSPYLCAMNYDDMEYGRVIYGYMGAEGYKAVNTDVTENPGIEGHIPAGDAVFTQTATLETEETFGVSQTAKDGGASAKEGDAYGGMADISVAITRTGETRAADGGEPVGDVLQLNAVEPVKARTDFDISADGVKWMADGAAQIYAVMGGGRYSLLSAVNVEGEVAIGVTVPEAGMYTIAVPDDCLADGYETVVLEDNVAHKSVDLLEGGYDFTAAAPGDIEGRFTVSFNRMVDDGRNDGIRAYSVQPGVIRVEGVAEGDRITVYSADGMAAAQRVAASSAEDIAASVAAVAVVKVERDGKTVAVRKLKMKN